MKKTINYKEDMIDIISVILIMISFIFAGICLESESALWAVLWMTLGVLAGTWHDNRVMLSYERRKKTIVQEMNNDR